MNDAGRYNVIRLPEVIGSGYRDFWLFRGRYRVVKGSRRSKKSKTTALWLIYHLMKYPLANALVIRKTYRTLRDSCFAELKWAMRRLGSEHLWRVRESPLEMTYIPTGQKIFFRGLDDPLKITSIAAENGVICWMWIEEAFEIDRESDFEMLAESLLGDCPAGLWKQITLTFNPWSGTHWLKRRFFDHPDADTLAMTTNYLCNEWLSEADRQVFERMRENNPRRYDVAGLGNWGVEEGLIYQNWTIDAFDIHDILQGADGWKYKCVFGLDYGYTNDPTAFVAAAVNPADKVLYIYDEHSETRMLNSDIARMLTQKGVDKEQIRADAAEPKSNEELRRLGIRRIVAAAKGADSIRAGVAGLQEYRMIVHTACKSTIAELSTYHWDKKTGTEDGINKPVDRDNHLMDALRYAMEDAVYFRPVRDVPRGMERGANGSLIYRDGRYSNIGRWDE